MKMKVRDLRKLLREFSNLHEELPVAPRQAGDPNQLQNDSLDAQIDRFLMQGDDGASQDQQPAPEAAPPAAPAPPAPAQQAEGLLREEGEAQPNPKQINAVVFADNVARLVEKFDNLIDVKGTVVRRALNYVAKNYDAKQSKTVEQVLAGNFGLEAVDNPSGDDGEADLTPVAKGAGSGLNQG